MITTDIKPENIDKYLAKYQAIPFDKYDEHRIGTRNRIYRVGIELEGGWDNLATGVNLEHDGSVAVRPRSTPANPSAPTFRAGELPSGILEPSKVEPFLLEFYPDHVNESCGMHIHQSVKSALHYQLLMTPVYQATIIHYLKLWATAQDIAASHHFWKRLAGQNQYCKLEYFADEQASAPTKNYNRNGGVASRYTAINYTHKQHGTVECRVLPMFTTKKQAIKAAKYVLDLTNAFLAKQKRKEEKHIATIDIVEGVRDHQEETLSPRRLASRT